MNPFPKMVENPQGAGTEEEQLMQMLQSNPELMSKYKQQLTKFQAQAKKSAQHPPMTSAEYIDQLDTVEKYFDSEGGLTIEPSKAFVLKFLEKRSSQKIFVNIVTHEVIDHPEQKLLVDFENQPGLRIPMSMGRVREDTDKNGTPCKVVDVVLNPRIVETAESNPDILTFTAQIIGNYLLEKHKMATQEQMVRKVKGVKYKGSRVEVQRVKGRKAPKIEQLSQQDQSIKDQLQQKEEEVLHQLGTSQPKRVMRPAFYIHALGQDGLWESYSIEVRGVTVLKIVVELPHLIHSRGIHLEGSTSMVYLLVKNLYELCLKIPFDVESFKCRFGRKERKLEITVFKKQEEHRAADREGAMAHNPEKKIAIELENELLYDLV